MTNAVQLLGEIAKLNRHPQKRGNYTTLNVPKELLERIDACLREVHGSVEIAKLTWGKPFGVQPDSEDARS